MGMHAEGGKSVSSVYSKKCRLESEISVTWNQAGLLKMYIADARLQRLLHCNDDYLFE